MNTNSDHESFFSSLERALPAVFSREEAARHMGGLLRAKTLSNLDAAGKGPKKVRIGKKKVAYEKHSFMKWVRQYSGL